MQRADTLLSAATQSLREAGIERPRREARLLLALALDAAPEALLAANPPSVDQAGERRFASLLARRCAREPLSHLRGRREFWSLEFEVGPAVLDPRADTETLVAAILEEIADRKAALRLLDLGTGSGCILLSLLHELPQARGLGVDISDEALTIAARNAAALDLAGRAAFQRADWCDGLVGPFDIAVSNPPYIRHAEIAGLMPEVARHDPKLALDGGADGLEAYRRLADGLAAHLVPRGVVGLEIGAGQMAAVKTLFTEQGFDFVRSARDLAGIERVLILRRR